MLNLVQLAGGLGDESGQYILELGDGIIGRMVAQGMVYI
jgi:hypothetical protein